MSTLDWIIVAFAALLACSASGGGSSWGCSRLRDLCRGLPRDAPRPASAAARIGLAVCSCVRLIGALLAGAILATGLEGVGFRLRRRTLVVPGVGVLDGVFGALLGAALGLGIAWIAAAVAGQTPGDGKLRADIQRSVILGELNRLLPPTGPILNALSRLDPLPQVAGPSPDVGAPLPRIGRAPGVRAASRSVVRVLGTACGLAIEGSGWVAGPDEVVTNAHVVAGESDTTVELGGAPPHWPPKRSRSTLPTTSRCCACPVWAPRRR